MLAEIDIAHPGNKADAWWNPLTRKFENFRHLSSADQEAVDIAIQRVQRQGSREDIVQQGDEPRFVHMILEG